MDSYNIIDEPKPKAYENLIVDPLAIFFVGVFVPILWMPPFLGKYWMPIAWLLANGYFMGSPTFKKEIGIACLGCISMAALLFIFYYINATQNLGKSSTQYFRIFIQATLFLTMYFIVFAQSGPYAIHKYVKEQRDS